jgi:hypothetical protein
MAIKWNAINSFANHYSTAYRNWSPVDSAEAIELAALKPQMRFRLCVLDTQIRMG